MWVLEKGILEKLECVLGVRRGESKTEVRSQFLGRLSIKYVVVGFCYSKKALWS